MRLMSRKLYDDSIVSLEMPSHESRSRECSTQDLNQQNVLTAKISAVSQVGRTPI